jgi:hypothetical protein
LGRAPNSLCKEYQFKPNYMGLILWQMILKKIEADEQENWAEKTK